jgi:hypothetical protein
MSKRHFFLSHSSNDKAEIVKPVGENLLKLGKTIWLDEAEIIPGDDLSGKISIGLTTSDLVVTFISKSFIAKKWTMVELNSILSIEISTGSIRLIPILIDITEQELQQSLPLIASKVFLKWENNPNEIAKELKKTHDKIFNINKIRVLFDQAHKQNRWRGSPTADAGYKEALNSISDIASIKVNENEKFSLDSLNDSDILILPTPYGIQVSEDEYDELANWIFNGGGLLTFGFYLMELHHFFNLNKLVRKLGFEFNRDLIVPQEKEDFFSCMKQAFGYEERDLWVTTKPIGNPINHQLLEGVEKIALLSSCSIDYLSNDYEVVVSLSDELWRMKARGHSNSEGRLLQLLEYYKDKLDKHPFLLAKKYGDGKVVGIGTWKVFLNAFINDKELNNDRLFKNCIGWLFNIQGRVNF